MYFPEGKFLIVGLAASGFNAAREILARGGKCMIYDESQSEHILRNKAALAKLGAVDVAQSVDDAVSWADTVILSPGIPVDHRIPVAARRLRKRVMGELELGSSLIKAPIIAVTGTNGKTTTSSLIHAIFKKAGLDSYMVGNSGSPITEHVAELNENAVAVTEVSSFQLETVHLFCPHIAVILNITPDHLERHYNMENYVYLKRRILSNMRESEFAVLNADDEIVRGFAENLRTRAVFFSTKGETDGAYFSGGAICFKGEYVMNKSEIPLAGEHNEENVLAAVCVARLMGISCETIAEAVSGFGGVRHRMELVAEGEGVAYYNDSKATNADAALSAVKTMTRPTVIILGGKDKELEYDGLFAELKNSAVVRAVLVGETRFKMLEAARRAGFDCVTVTDGFENAIKIARAVCPDGGAVLLSPATSSFDAFSGFEERGDAFVRIVKELVEEDE